MNLKRIILAFALIVFSINSAFATQLPKPVQDFVLTNYPNSTLRFDGMITLQDGTVYIPVIPSYLEKVEKLDVTYIYPQKTTIKDKPEVIVFNNNYALLKLIKTKNGILTVCPNPNLPMTIKTGALPQDILVPKGLVFPEALKGILGNVQVPLLTANTVIKEKNLGEQKLIVQTVQETTTAAQKAQKAQTTTNLNLKLKNKNYYITNFDTQYLKVFSSNAPNPAYSLKLSGVPKDMKAVSNGKYLIVISNNQKIIDVIDVQNEYIAKQIDLSVMPNELAIDEKNNKAYVSSISDKSIFVVDLKDMKIKEKINLIGSPEKIAISENGSELAYIDRATSNLYILKLDGSYENKLIVNAPNTSKIILSAGKLYKINRVENKFSEITYDLEKDFTHLVEKKHPSEEKLTFSNVINGIVSNLTTPESVRKSLIQEIKYYSTDEKTIETGITPTDILSYNNKIFILCSKSNNILIYDTKTQKLSKDLKLPTNGFSRRITMVPNTNMAIITNVLENKYLVMDMDRETIIQSVYINTPVNAITIVDKR